MPELPEVETVVTGLRSEVLGNSFHKIQIFRTDLRQQIPSNIADLILNHEIIDVRRKAKYILIHLANAQVLIMHLGMSGKIVIGKNEKPKKHDHIIFTLSSNQQITFNDPRRFGLVITCSTAGIDKLKLFANLGPEPLSSDFTTDYLSKTLKSRSSPIKTTIMNNEVVVGVGNIYACEALFKAKISPLRPANFLTISEIENLVAIIKEVLALAIQAGGSSLKDYVNINGDLGYFQNQLQVYGRANLDCHICNSKILQIKQGGRSSFYCGNCQK